MLTERFLWERPVTELILEKALHKAKIPFKSNVFIGRYEVDFLVDSLIAVEVDGYVHYLKDVMEKDVQKNKDLRRMGYEVLRFTGDEVRYDTKKCIKTISDTVTENKGRCLAGRSLEKLAPWQQALYDAYHG